MKLTKILTVFFALTLIFTGISSEVMAEDLSGREVIQNVYEREEGESREAEMNMVLINKHGDKRVRDLKQFNKDFGDVEKKIMFFTGPQDIRGTSFMNWSYEENKEDNQWIYLPALGKIKRISSDSKGDYFMGSDFTYDDLGERNIDADNHKLLRTDTLDGEEVYVVESIPKDEDYMYSKTITWVIKDKWIGLKKEFYDRSGEHLKTLKVNEYKEIDGIITVTESEMHNIQKDHKTQLKLDEVKYNSGIDENTFSVRQMKMGI